MMRRSLRGNLKVPGTVWGPIVLAMIVVAASVAILPTNQATAGPMNNPDSIWFWCGEAGGKKEVAPETPFVLPTPRHGTVGLLVLKAGSGENAYTQFENPTPGDSYSSSTGEPITFAIWCREGPPETTTTEPVPQ